MEQNKLISNLRLLPSNDNQDFRQLISYKETKYQFCCSGAEFRRLISFGAKPYHTYITLPYNENNPFYNKLEAGWYYNNAPAIKQIVEVKENDIKGLNEIYNNKPTHLEKVIAATDKNLIWEKDVRVGYLPSISQDTLKLLPSLYKGEVIKVEVETEPKLQKLATGEIVIGSSNLYNAKLKLTPNNELVVTPIEDVLKPTDSIFDNLNKLCEEANLPKIGTKEFNDMCSVMFGRKKENSTPIEEVNVITVDNGHLEQPQILKDFISAIKNEFKDENWEYLDFIADRVISQQPKVEDKSLNDTLIKFFYYLKYDKGMEQLEDSMLTDFQTTLDKYKQYL